MFSHSIFQPFAPTAFHDTAFDDTAFDNTAVRGLEIHDTAFDDTAFDGTVIRGTIFVAVLMTLLTTLGLAGSAAAEPVLDQFQLDGTDQTRSIHRNLSLGQSFTVGMDGYLAGVELSLLGPGTGDYLSVKIVEAGDHDARVGEAKLFTGDLAAAPQTLDAAEITATYIDLTGFAIAVTAGQELALLLESTAASEQSFATHISFDPDSYEGGTLIADGSPTVGDLIFKTFVQPELELSAFVDQSQLNGFDQGRVISATASFGQTFTVGKNGLLEGVELLASGIGTTEPLLIEILDVSQGLDDAVVLGSKLLFGSEAPGTGEVLHHSEIRGSYVDLKSEGIIVVAGDQLALQFSTEDPGFAWSLRRALSDLYPGGAVFADNAFSVNSDFAFKTFVSDPIFGDDFETGDLSRWGQVVQ